MARALRHDADNAQAFDLVSLFKCVDDLLSTITIAKPAALFESFIREIDIRERDRKISAGDTLQEKVNDLCFLAANRCS